MKRGTTWPLFRLCTPMIDQRLKCILDCQTGAGRFVLEAKQVTGRGCSGHRWRFLCPADFLCVVLHEFGHADEIMPELPRSQRRRPSNRWHLFSAKMKFLLHITHRASIYAVFSNRGVEQPGSSSGS